jgi:hypothetical protein
MWGARKGNPNMAFNHLSRILRYYSGKLIDKVEDKPLTYRFTVDLEEVTGYSARELRMRVNRAAASNFSVGPSP